MALLGPTVSDPVRSCITRMELSLHDLIPRAPELDPSVTLALANSLRARLRKTPPAGAKWAERFGPCGEILFEDGTSDSHNVPCGTGFLPAQTRHFLTLLTS
jgi:hypothetical protein